MRSVFEVEITFADIVLFLVATPLVSFSSFCCCCESIILDVKETDCASAGLLLLL